METRQKAKCYEESTYEVAGVLREPGRPAVAYMVTPDKERRYLGGAFITLNGSCASAYGSASRRRRASR